MKITIKAIRYGTFDFEGEPETTVQDPYYLNFNLFRFKKLKKRWKKLKELKLSYKN